MSHNRIHAGIRRALLLAWLFSGALYAATETLPLTVTPGLNSLEWIVSNTAGTSSGTAFAGNCDGSVAGMGISEATSANAATDAYDNAWMLFVDNAVFVAPATVDLSGELFTAGPVLLSRLNTRLEILFSAVLQAARIRAIFANPTSSAITVDVDVPVNLGSDAATLIEQTSSIDNVFSIGDRWIVTSDNNVGLNAVNTTVIYGPGTPVATPLSVTRTVCRDSKVQDEGLGFSFRITIPARASRSLMFFAGLGDIIGTGNTITGAIANAASFNRNATIDSRLLSDLSDSERLEILNWNFATSINAAAAAAAADEPTFIDDFIGCSLGSRKTTDPTFPLLVLLAITGLALKRRQHASRHL